MRFETARVCVLRRTSVPRTVEVRPAQPGDEPQTVELRPDFEYEVVAWPPGEVDSGLLPQVGDEITLPGYDQPFRVVERALHWPAPSTQLARDGQLQVNLAVEAVGATSLNSPPWGRPGEVEIRREGRWLPARVSHYEARTSFGGENYVRVDFTIDGVGTLSRQIRKNWQALEMFPGRTEFQNVRSHEEAPQGAVLQCLQIEQEFEVRVAPSELPSQAGRLEIWEVRPPQRPEPADLANTWDNEAQEITDQAWGQL